jgi:branched-chain amino acid transport system permease protein
MIKELILLLLATIFAHVPLLLATIIAVLGAGILGVLTEVICFRHINRSYHDAPLVTSIAFGMILGTFVYVFWGTDSIPFPLKLHVESFQIGSISSDSVSLLIIIVAGFCVVFLDLFLQRTKEGMAIRAIAASSNAASLMGINVNRTISLVFFIGGILAGVASLLMGIKCTVVSPTTGIWFALKGLAVMAIGGLGNFRGAVWAALILGVVEAIGAGYGPTRLAEAIPWVFLMIVLSVKRGSLFRSMIREKL